MSFASGISGIYGVSTLFRSRFDRGSERVYGNTLNNSAHARLVVTQGHLSPPLLKMSFIFTALSQSFYKQRILEIWKWRFWAAAQACLTRGNRIRVCPIPTGHFARRIQRRLPFLQGRGLIIFRYTSQLPQKQFRALFIRKLVPLLRGKRRYIYMSESRFFPIYI